MASKDPNAAYAQPYARSLLELANEQGQAEPIRQELSTLREVIQQNPSFATFLTSPDIGHTERTEMLTRVLGTTLSPLMHNFIGVLNNKNRMGALPAIADMYEELLDEQLGKIEVDVTVAQRLSPEQLEQVRQKVSAALGKDAVVHQYVDESIIGGLILRVQDKMIDSSVRAQLQAMKQQLLSAGNREKIEQRS